MTTTKICPKCKGSDVYELAWINSNTKIFEEDYDIQEPEFFCGSCSDHIQKLGYNIQTKHEALREDLLKGDTHPKILISYGKIRPDGTYLIADINSNYYYKKELEYLHDVKLLELDKPIKLKL